MKAVFFILIYPILYLVLNFILGLSVVYSGYRYNGLPAYAYQQFNPRFYSSTFVYVLVMVGIFLGVVLLALGFIFFKRYLNRNYYKEIEEES